MENRKLLSVAVPTKNRYKYLKYLIELIASFKSDEIELVIQDNSDDNSEFVEYLNNLGYDFIRYDHTQGQIPMAINSDKAILNSTGEYVCFLGDDDGLTRFTIDCARWMKANDVEAVKSAEPVYNWPDVTEGSEGKKAANLSYKPFTGKIYYPNPLTELIKVLREGITSRGNMPLVYHSLVSRKLLDKIYIKTGTYFPGNSPDISNAVALSLTANKFAIIDLPFAYSGCSVFHGGGVHVNQKKGHPEICEVPWFRPNAEENWDKQVPKVAAGTFIWADSAINALKLMGRTDLYRRINFSRMYAIFVLNNRSYRNRVYDVCRNKPAFYCAYVQASFRKYFYAIFRRIARMMGVSEKTKHLMNVDNIIDATTELEKISKDRVEVFKSY